MSTASEPRVCPACGAPIPAEAPQGLCPRCLLLGASLATEAGQTTQPKSAPPSVADIAAAFPHLEILGLIGQGGMGYVFKARQPKLDRFVALKILPQSLAADPAFAERFAREGRVLARLNHPHIVTIHDFGQAGGFFYLLIEFVNGVNLRQAMQTGQIQPDQALAIVPKICDALQFAHNEGILHRDIKPENIMLDAKGRVKITDFGIAKLMGNTANQGPLSRSEETPGTGEGREGIAHPEGAITETGKVLGTPQYMAPEQIEAPGKVDHRADIYSLGVVFYEMLTGELPLGRFAPPSQKSTADPRLDAVVSRTLEREPERRTQSAGEVKTQVETIATTKAASPTPETLVAGRAPPSGPPAAPPPPASFQFFRSGPIIFLLAGVLVFAALVGGFVVLYSGRAKPLRSPPPPGLISWWPGEGNAADSFGTNDGALMNGAGFAEGEVGRAFNFNGDGQFVDVPDSANLNPGNRVTVEAWIYPRQFAGPAPIVKKAGEGSTTDHGYELELAGSSGVVFGVYLGGGVGWVITGYAPVPLKEWSHVAGVYDGTNALIYVNGTLIGTASAEPGKIVPSGNHLQIGHDPANPARFFNGLIDEVSVYDTGLSASEIAAIYDARAAGKSPSPPAILNQPASQTLFAGQSTHFSVSANGGKPMSYQWLLNGAEISPSSNPTATNATLVLTNAQSGQSGGFYSVRLKNSSGTTDSLNAALTINPMPPGLVSWWRGEGDALDSFGANHGTIRGGVTFAPGLVGRAFDFDGRSGTVNVPDSGDLRLAGQITIEAWIYLRNTNGDQGIVSKLNTANNNGGIPIRGIGGDGGVRLVFSGSAAGSPSAVRTGRTNNPSFGGLEGYQFGLSGNQLVGLFNSPGEPWPSQAVTCPLPVALGTWNHVAWTYDQSVMKLYLNGQPIASNEVGPHVIAATGGELRISGAENHVYFNGLLDEVSLYDRALSASEIQAIYNAGSVGKPPSPPVIAGPPADQTAYYGDTVSYRVDARGAQPLSYQWLMNGKNISTSANATATSSTLVLTEVQSNQAGNVYSVVVSNGLGSITSAGASLTVSLRPPCAPTPAGLISSWSGEGNAQDSFGANNGTLIGGVTFAPGKVGKAFKINGDAFSQDYISVPDSPSLNPTAAITVEAWIFPTGPLDPAASPLVKKAGQGPGDPTGYSGYGLEFANISGVKFWVCLDQGVGWTGSPVVQVPMNQWSHLAGVYDGRTILFYLNGTLAGSTLAPGSLVPAHSPLQIGHDPYVLNRFFNGLIDEASVYNRALSGAEIRAIYDAGASGKCPSPPVIAEQPANQNIFQGEPASFRETLI